MSKQVCVRYGKRKEPLACFKSRRDAETYILLDGRRGLTLSGATKKRRR
jgi:hypothetical protein